VDGAETSGRHAAATGWRKKVTANQTRKGLREVPAAE
jgi:hypothetical protein